MSGQRVHGPLGIFQQLASAEQQNALYVKEAAARGSLPVETDQSKVASAQPQTQSGGYDVGRLSKIASAVGIGADLLLKQANETGPAAAQPASNVGPSDNESQSQSTGQHLQPSQQTSIYNGMSGKMEDVNHMATNENNSQPTAPGASGLGKEAHRRAQIDFLKAAASGMTVGVGSSGRGAAQPASSVGPADDEDRKIPHSFNGSYNNGSNEQIAQTRAQNLAAQHKRELFPLTEPAYNDINVESGDGAGPHGGSNDPRPSKTAAAQKAFLLKMAGYDGDEDYDDDDKDDKDDKDEDKSDDDKDEDKEKESMGLGSMAHMGHVASDMM